MHITSHAYNKAVEYGVHCEISSPKQAWTLYSASQAWIARFPTVLIKMCMRSVTQLILCALQVLLADGRTVPFTAAAKKKVQAEVDTMSASALRCLAFAQKTTLPGFAGYDGDMHHPVRLYYRLYQTFTDGSTCLRQKACQYRLYHTVVSWTGASDKAAHVQQHMNSQSCCLLQRSWQPDSNGKRDVDSQAKQIILLGEDFCPTSSIALGMSKRQAPLMQRCADWKQSVLAKSGDAGSTDALHAYAQLVKRMESDLACLSCRHMHSS